MKKLLVVALLLNASELTLNDAINILNFLFLDGGAV